MRGNGQIIQELEAIFRGAGWNVIKVIWGSDWDPLLAADHDGLLAKRMGEVVDGQYQKYAVEDGAYIREHFFGTDPRLLDMVKHLSDEQLKKLRLGGHDPVKVFNAYKAAIETTGQPTVILARTIKGYGLGEAGEGKNITHQQKKMNEADLRVFRTRFGIPISDEEIADAPFYRPPEDSPELQYLRERRKALGGYVPSRSVRVEPLKAPIEPLFEEFYKGTDGRKASTTMVFVRILSKLLRDKEIGDLIVPIVPDEARTFGMESLFRASASTPTSARSTSRSTWTRCSITRKRRTARFSRKGSPKPGRCRRSSPPAPPTPPTASTRSRSSSTTRCSASSASAI